VSLIIVSAVRCRARRAFLEAVAYAVANGICSRSSAVPFALCRRLTLDGHELLAGSSVVKRHRRSRQSARAPDVLAAFLALAAVEDDTLVRWDVGLPRARHDVLPRSRCPHFSGNSSIQLCFSGATRVSDGMFTVRCPTCSSAASSSGKLCSPSSRTIR
jgi:hypothetical protein